MIAAGEEARQMLGRTPGKIEVVRPMKDGVIADIEATEMMLKHFINSLNIKGMLSQPRIMICCPTNITLVEKMLSVKLLKNVVHVKYSLKKNQKLLL